MPRLLSFSAPYGAALCDSSLADYAALCEQSLSIDVRVAEHCHWEKWDSPFPGAFGEVGV